MVRMYRCGVARRYIDFLITVCKYKIMRIGQFWRLKKLYVILNYAIVLSERFF